MNARILKQRFTCWYAGVLAAAWLCATLSVHAQSNLVLFISQPGDYIGQGQTYVTTNTANFSFSGSPNLVTVGAFGYTFWIGGPGGANLAVGVYTNSARYPFNGSQPGLDVFGNGRGCNTDCGAFQIFELHTNDSGQIDRVWLTFSNTCECYFAPMTGEIRYNSLLAPPVPVPRTIRVPADYPTIQAALYNASLLTIDTVLVSPGTYNEAVTFAGRNAHLLSVAGPGATFLTAPLNSSAVTFSSGETSDALVSGFTISGGTGVSVSSASPTIASNILLNCGTGINCNFASPTVRDNSILNCAGDAIYLGGAATPLIEGNIIKTNTGAVIMFAAGSPTIRNNLIQGTQGDALNMVNQSDANIVQNVIYENSGNGIYWLVPSGARGPWVINNTIVNNGSYGIYADGYDATAQIVNNIIVGNQALGVGTFNDLNPPIIQYNDVYSPTGGIWLGQITNMTGVAGNISTNPLFVCQPSDDFHLLAVSLCIDSGTNGAALLPPNDFDGHPRIIAGTNGTAVVDIGAFEFNPTNAPVPCLYISCPSNIVAVAAPGQNSVIVNYPPPTGAPVATITSLPPSGSAFPAGTNIVTCTASYGTNSAICTFTINVLVLPTIVSQSASTNVLAGQSFSLLVTPAGTAPFTYQWMFENANISGGTGQTLTVNNAQSANEGIYRVAVGNAVGSVTSAPVAVRVLPAAPLIVSNPVSLSVAASSNATFAVSAIGSQPVTYQWFFQGAPIAGASASQYSLLGVQSGNSGAYRVVVNNSLGSATSTVANLTVTALAPYFTLQPVGASLSAGSSRTLTGQANGSLPIGYQWRRNGTNLSGATQTSLALTNLAVSDSAPYTLVASNVAGVSTSAVAQITVYQTPTLVQGLTNVVVDMNSNVSLAVNALGSPTLAYSWQLNGQPIAGAGPSLNLTNIQLSQSGYYRVSVTNQYGSVSSTGRVSVLGLSSQVIAWGDNSGGQTNVPAQLSDAVAAAGGDYHSAALRHNGTLIAWGYNGDNQTSVPTNALRFVSLASGAGHNLAITETGSLVAWGRNDAGQCNIPAGASNSVLGVAAGDAHSLALLSSGLVVAWGDNSFGQCSVPQGLSGVKAIAAGRNHSLALRVNGTVVGWGFNAYGQATAPVLSNVVAIAGGYLHSVALLSNGTVVVWGDNTFGQGNVPAGLTNLVAIAAGDYHTLGLRADGTVVGWGDNTYGQIAVPGGLNNVFAVASGNYHGLALMPSLGLLQPSLVASHFVVRWSGNGTLQWAPTPLGPYTDLATQGNSYTNLDMSPPAKFFRLRR